MTSRHQIARTQVVPAPLDDVFAFFSDAANLQLLTPSFLDFAFVTPLPIEMRRGALIEYRIRLMHVPMRWLTEITLWEPGKRFVDEQRRGPYRRWHHLHEFRSVPGGTEVADTVDYELPFGPLGSLAHALFVRRMLSEIFDFRVQAIAQHFSPNRHSAAAASGSQSAAGSSASSSSAQARK